MKEVKTRIERFLQDSSCSCVQLDDHLTKLQKLQMAVDVPEQIVQIGKALSEVNRIKLLKLIDLNSMCSCELEYVLHLSQPTITYHLQQLQRAGLISMEKSGKWTLLSLKSEKTKKLLQMLELFADD